MTPERRQRILDVADELEAAGEVATNAKVYAICMGHRGHIVQVLKARRAGTLGEGGVAVMDLPDEADDEGSADTPAAELVEDLQQLEASHASWHASLELLWAAERDGPLSEAQFGRKTWLEYQLTANTQAQEQVRAQVDLALLREAVCAAVQQHDTLVPEAQAGAARVLEDIANLKRSLATLASVFNAQVGGLMQPRDRRGHQFFDLGAGEDLSRLFQAFFPSDYRAKDTLALLLSETPTVGQAREALANCPRLQPFSHTAITSYLNTLAPEGHTNGRDT